jgi:hypothetical protein
MITTKNNLGFGTLELQCVSSTETQDKTGYINKLQHKSTISATTPFGAKTQPVQHTFYMKTDTPVKPGFKASLNLDEYRITERPYDIDDASSDLNGQTIMLKWLHL